MSEFNIKEKMKSFEEMINTCNDALGEELIEATATFITPASKEPLRGAQGYLSFVRFMRQSFPDVQWKAKEIVAENNIAAVLWECSGTHKGAFLGNAPTGKHFSTTIMNFYYFNDNGKIINDVADVGMIGILQQLEIIKL